MIATELSPAQYYGAIFDPNKLGQVAAFEAALLRQVCEHRKQLEQFLAEKASLEPETKQLAAIFSKAAVINFSDVDGTRVRIGEQGSVNARIDQAASELIAFEAGINFATVKVSGRSLVSPDSGLLKDIDQLPELAIGEAGAAIAVNGVESIEYRSFLQKEAMFSRNKIRAEINAFLESDTTYTEAYRWQVSNAFTFKLSLDVKIKPSEDDQLLALFFEQLGLIAGDNVKVVCCEFIEAREAGVDNTYRIDLAPGDKATATNYLVSKLVEAGVYKPIITAGDSGNDIGLLQAAKRFDGSQPEELLSKIVAGEEFSTNVFIAVANSTKDLLAELKELTKPASEYLDRPELNGIYLLISPENGTVQKLIINDAERPGASERYGPESILYAYQGILSKLT